jgi:hypothetical protein
MDEQKAREAWLIMWKWSGEQAKAQNRVVAIVSSRKSASIIKKLVEQIWAINRLYWHEQVAFARYSKNLAYKAEVSKIVEGHVTCGHNPWLEAKRVYDLRAYVDEDGNQRLEWKCPNYRELEDGELEITYRQYHLVKDENGDEFYDD